MRRSGPLRRRTPLRPDPELVREWQRSTRTPLRQSKRRRPAVSANVRAAAVRRSSGDCAVCVADGRTRPARAVHVHHVLPARTFPQWINEPLNLVGICPEHHDEHERARRRIRWRALPVAVRSWVADRMREDGAVAAFVLRTYPR